jgi:VanZ family protein
MRFFLIYWLPVLVWMAIIFVLSTSWFSMAQTAQFVEPLLRRLFPRLKAEGLSLAHVRFRESAHFGEYLVLGMLVFHAIRGDSDQSWRPRWMLASSLWTVGYAVLDELHQRWERGRTPKLRHVLIDAAGGCASQLLIFVCIGGREHA